MPVSYALAAEMGRQVYAAPVRMRCEWCGWEGGLAVAPLVEDQRWVLCAVRCGCSVRGNSSKTSTSLRESGNAMHALLLATVTTRTVLAAMVCNRSFAISSFQRGRRGLDCKSSVPQRN